VSILRISVRTLVIRFMSLLLILASPPEEELAPPKAASGTLFDQPTVQPAHTSVMSPCLRVGEARTACEESVLGEDRDGVDEEDRD
jgi:hypothetical protein